MPVIELTTELLTPIRDGVERLEDGLGATNARIDETNRRLSETNRRLGHTRTELLAAVDRVERRLDERIDGLQTRLDARIDGVEARLARVETRQAGTNDRLLQIAEILGALTRRVQRLEPDGDPEPDPDGA